ncbi:hypothetical protein P4C99_20250 [Pontiellaceae bacterium B1224]|nr:hypothetical protein [Pontiellaceae bacterium B1224]
MLDKILEELRLDCKLCKMDRGYKCGADIGIIIGFNDDFVCIKKYDRDGLYDGIKLFRKSDIEELVYNGNELHSINKFIQNRGTHLEPVDLDCSGFDEFMESACGKYGYVSLNKDSDNTCYIGQVIGHDDDFVHILNYGNPSRRDKTNVVLAKWEIESMDVDDIYGRNLMSIHTHKIRA